MERMEVSTMGMLDTRRVRVAFLGGCLPLHLLPRSPGTHWIAGTICSSPFPSLRGSLSC